MNSKLIEHLVILAVFISIFWKWWLKSDYGITALLYLEFFLIILPTYFIYVLEKRWPTWNSERPHFWFHQLKSASRQSQTLGLWCVHLLLLLAFQLSFSNSASRQRDIFPLAILVMLHCPMILKFLLYYILRRWKLCTLLSHIGSTFLNVFVLRSIFSFPLASAIALSPLPSLLSSFLVPKLMTMAAKSFTLGEFTLIYSGLILALIFSVQRISSTKNNGQLEAIFLISAWSLLSCSSFILLCFVCPILRRSAVAFWLLLGIAVASAYLLCLFLNGLDFLTWLMNFILFNKPSELAYQRWILLTFWLICVACTIRFAVACWSMTRLSTVHRKFFHLTIGLVVISGLLYDPSLTLVCSVLVFDGFVVLEVIRLCEVEPIGKSLRETFEKFLDHQDQGPLVLTPIYLLIACFLPLWIDAPVDGIVYVNLRHFAGLISVGVGDAAAAVGGTWIGRTPWRVEPNCRKTIEGTLCGFIAQVVITFCIMKWLGSLSLLVTWGGIAWILWSCFLTSMLETFSHHVDNLVLPLCAFLLLSDL